MPMNLTTEEDDDCDGVINEDSAIDVTLFYQDADSDGYGLNCIPKEHVPYLQAMQNNKGMIGTVMTMTPWHDLLTGIVLKMMIVMDLLTSW